MIMPKVEIHRAQTYNNLWGCEVRKARGKLSMEEITDALREAEMFGGWAVILRVGEDSGYQGWMDEDTRGDSVFLYELEDGEQCPICASQLVVNYCPNCGEDLRQKKEGC
jgi:hypothetical protein